MDRVVLDIEVYRDYLLIILKHVERGTKLIFETYPGSEPLDVSRLRSALSNYEIVTFNGRNYDMPMIAYALTGASNAMLKKASDAIIQQNLRAWDFENEFGCSVPNINHIDLIEVAPGMASLKIYGGRLHSKKLQDLPIAHDASITPAQRELLKVYCENDLDTTIDLMRRLDEQLTLREEMSVEYGIDLRSKSDAQIAEAVISSRMEKALGTKVSRPIVPPGTKFKYMVPEFISFKTPVMQDVLRTVINAEFVVNDKGAVEMPEEITNLAPEIGYGVYRMGIGGLHSSEANRAVLADHEHVLIDRDVASYYPAIILNCRLYPEHLGPKFLDVYRSIVERRLAAKNAAKVAKKAGDKELAKHQTTIANSLKITINGSFGKLGSMWSKLYSPNLMIQTTITGQLALLMLIERLEMCEIEVASANTDGIVIRCHKAKAATMDEIVAAWERCTGFETEAVEYSALYSASVNAYFAVKTNGEVKLKGPYANEALNKNPQTPICSEAVCNLLVLGIPVEDTIRHCSDVRQFLTVKKVDGGAIWVKERKMVDDWILVEDHGSAKNVWHSRALNKRVVRKSRPNPMPGIGSSEYLGRAVRWIYSANHRDAYIAYERNGNLVGKSEGARPLMELPDKFPDDIDYAWYIEAANKILEEIGYA